MIEKAKKNVVAPKGLRSNLGLLACLNVVGSEVDISVGDLVRFVIMPLDEELKISRHYPVFKAELLPSRLRHKLTLDNYSQEQIDQYKRDEATNRIRLIQWYRGLGTPRRINFLGFDLPQQVEFLVEFMGGKPAYLEIFQNSIRDLAVLEKVRLDVLAYNGYPQDLNDGTLERLAKRYGVSFELRNSPERLCLLYAEIYRKILYEEWGI